MSRKNSDKEGETKVMENIRSLVCRGTNKAMDSRRSSNMKLATARNLQLRTKSEGNP